MKDLDALLKAVADGLEAMAEGIHSIAKKVNDLACATSLIMAQILMKMR